MKRRAAAALVLALTAGAGAAEETLSAEEVAPGVFVLSGRHELVSAANRGAISNAGFVVGGEAVAVIDTRGSVAAGRELLQAVRRVTDLPVRYVINTHMHPDHVFGNAAFRGSGPGASDPAFVGHHKLARALASRASYYLEANAPLLGDELSADIEIILPDHPVNDAEVLDLGGRRLSVRAWATAHTDNDLTVLDERTGTLFAGDLVFMGHLPVVDGSLVGWLAQHDDLAAIKAERVVPGHGPPSAPWPDALAAQRSYLTALAAAVREAIAAGVPMAGAVEEMAPPDGAWQLVDDFHKRNAIAAYAELEWE